MEQSDLAVGAGGEVAVAALGGDGAVAVAVPDEERFAEAGAGGDEAGVAFGVGRAGVKGEDLVGGQLGDAVAVGFEVVDEEDVLDAERLREVADVEGPGEVGELEAAVADGAGTPKQAARMSSRFAAGVSASAVRNLLTTSSRLVN